MIGPRPPVPPSPPGEARAYDAETLARVRAACEASPDREACGFVVDRGGGLMAVVPIANVADVWHARDPAGWPRTSRDGYAMDPVAQLRLMQLLDRTGGTIAAIWHSHVETDATFSAQDHADALVDGAPAVPGAEYLVVAVRGGRATEVRRYAFRAGAYAEVPLA